MSIGIYTLVLFGAAAIAHSVLVALLSISDRRSAFRTRLIWLCASTVLACAGLAVRADSILGPGGAVLEIAITGGWCAFTLYLLRKQRPAEGQLWLVITALLAVATSLICALLLTAPLNEGQLTGSATLAIYARLGLAIIGLLATENLYRNTALEARWHISLLAAALAGMFVYTIVLYADALLYRAVSDLLW